MIKDIIEQHAIYDGEPDIQPLNMAINLLNHNSYGGTPDDLVWAQNDADLSNPKRYKVTLTLSVEEVE